MSRTELTLRGDPPLRIDARSLQPLALARLSAAEIERLPLRQGRRSVAVGELFDVVRGSAASDHEDAAELHLHGDCTRLDHIGWTLAGGSIHVDGAAGDHAGGGMSGGQLTISGNAGDMAGCAMRGGRLEIGGDCGDMAASALPGEIDGMRGGTLLIRGNAGARLADRMRRGSVIVFGDAGDYLASRMVAGTLAIAGSCGAHPAYGMRRGSLVFAGPAPVLGPTFAPLDSNVDVFWQLLARDLARHGGVFGDLPARRPRRLAGDLAVQGKGEILLAAAGG